MPIEHVQDQRVRRAVRRAGYLALKSRCKNPLDNGDGYMIVDPSTGFPVAGWGYTLSPEAAIAFCA
jgi:hypothetical protein